MKYESVLFDMDGTLLNTLEDLQDGVNIALAAHGYPLRTLEEIREFVGNGSGVLIHRALPEGTAAETEARVLAEYKEWYRINYCNKSHPYPGMEELLETLRSRGVKLAVVSNKPDATTKALARKFFPGLPAFGQRDDIPRKPAPEMVWHAMEAIAADRESSVYVGDSEVDVATARNAGLPVISCTWGFRSVETLRRAGADTFAATAEELLEKLG